MAKKPKQPDYVVDTEEDCLPHPSQDTSSRFAVDQLLRSYGFKIYSRYRQCEAVWIKDGVIYRHNDAIKTVCFRRLQEAVELEEWYARGLYS